MSVASMTGPTTMGIVAMMADPETYLGPTVSATFSVESTPDAITPGLVSGDIDVALVPANLAAVLYARTGGNVQVAGINTGNVLYVVARAGLVSSVEDLRGRTVYSTGQGTTPDVVMSTVLAAHQLTGQVDVRYVSQATEVASRLLADPTGIAVLPEPYVTTVLARDPSLAVAIDLGAQFQEATGTPVVTGVTVVRKDFADAHRATVATFLQGAARSADAANVSPQETGALVAEQGITPSAEVAAQAIPRSGLMSVTGADMRAALTSYYQALFAFDPQLIGGFLPGEDFYWVA